VKECLSRVKSCSVLLQVFWVQCLNFVTKWTVSSYNWSATVIIYVVFLFKIIAVHLSTQRRENVKEVIDTDGTIRTLKCSTLMVSLFHFLDLFNDIFSTSHSMFSEVCWMLHNNFERMSCVPALPGGNEEKHENLIQDRLHPGQEPKLELLNTSQRRYGLEELAFGAAFNI
jgi:hypothetical protein